jgi:hypothetical protein
MYGAARQFALLADSSGVRVAAFREEGHARAWLMGGHGE